MKGDPNETTSNGGLSMKIMAALDLSDCADLVLIKSAAEEIIKYQQSEKLDLIVLGRRSHTRRGTCPMGAVAQRVAAYATCTVMVVRCMEKRDLIDWIANRLR